MMEMSIIIMLYSQWQTEKSLRKDLTLGETESEPGTNPDPKPSTGCQMGTSVLGLLFVPLALLIRKKEE